MKPKPPMRRKGVRLQKYNLVAGRREDEWRRSVVNGEGAADVPLKQVIGCIVPWEGLFKHG